MGSRGRARPWEPQGWSGVALRRGSGVQRQTVGQMPSVAPPPRMVGSQGHCLTQLLGVPRLTPGPSSGRKSRVSLPGAGCSWELGIMSTQPGHWPLSERRPALARRAPQIQSRVRAPGLQPEATWQGGGRAGSSTSWGPPGPRWGCGSSSPLPASSGPCPVCVNYRRPLPSPAWKPARRGRFLRQSSRTSGHSGQPAVGTLGWWGPACGPRAGGPSRSCPALLGSL